MRIWALDLPGPSRRITVEPVQVPEPARRTEPAESPPEHRDEPVPAPAERPREPEPTPA